MGKIKKFDEFGVSESLNQKDVKSAIKDIFDKFDGEVKDKYLKDMWEKDSTLRNLYGKAEFDKAWDSLVKDENISTEDGKTWKWSGKY